MPPYLVKGLYLHGADKGHQRIGKRLKDRRQEAYRKQKHHLTQQNDLPPVDLFAAFEPDMNPLCNRCPDQERQNRDQIFQHSLPLPLEQCRTEQHDVPRLGVGKHLPPARIGVCILKSAGENDKKRCPEAVGHLPPNGLNALHSASSFRGMSAQMPCRKA